MTFAFFLVYGITPRSLSVLQLKVLAYDGGSPPLSATATVHITVQRNLKAPVFAPNRYETEILETQPLADPIVTVTARDEDRLVSRSLIY